MPDSYDAAGAQIDEQKRAMLAAMAQAGTAGVQAYNAAQADVQARQQASVQAAMSDAARYGGMRGGNPGSDVATAINLPYDRTLNDIASNRAYNQAQIERSTAANSTYFDQVKGAIPALRTYSQAEAAKLAQSQRMDQLNYDLKLRELDLKDQELNGSGAGGVLPQLIKSLGGIANANKYIADQRGQFIKAAKSDFGYQRASVDGEQPSDSRLSDLFDEQAGLPPGYSNSQVKPAKAATRVNADKHAKVAGFTDNHAANVRRTSAYTRAVKYLKSQSEAGTLDRAAFNHFLTSKYLNKNAYTADVRRLLEAEALDVL